MGIAGQQRRARRGVAAIDRPFVRCAAGQSVGRRKPGQHAGQPRRAASLAGGLSKHLRQIALTVLSSHPAPRQLSGRATADRATQPAPAPRGLGGQVPAASSSTATVPWSSPTAGCPMPPTVRGRRAPETRGGEAALEVDPGIHPTRIGLQVLSGSRLAASRNPPPRAGAAPACASSGRSAAPLTRRSLIAGRRLHGASNPAGTCGHAHAEIRRPRPHRPPTPREHEAPSRRHR